MAVHLDAVGDLPDLSLLRDEAREELLEILKGHPGRVCLVLDPEIMGLLNHVVVEGSSLLKSKGVVRFHKLTDPLGRLSEEVDGGSVDHVVFLIRARVLRAAQVAGQLEALKRSEPHAARQYGCYFVPHRTLACEQVFEEAGVLRSLAVGEFAMDLVPLERDLVSMELDCAFGELFADGDHTSLDSVARALSKWQAIYGVVPHVKCRGDLAEQALERLMRLRVDDALMDRSAVEDATMMAIGAAPASAVDTMIVLDRAVDYVTPLVTPLTYEGLIDELMGIQNAQVQLDSSLLDTGDELPGEKGEDKANERKAAEAKAEARPATMALALNSNDELYQEIRDRNVAALGQILQQRAKSIKDLYSGFRSNRNASVSEIAAFWKQVPELKLRYKSLSQHINVAAELKKTTDSIAFRDRWQIERGLLEGETHLEIIEEAIHAEEPARSVLKLLCLQSLCGGGIRTKYFDSLRREFLQTYGYHYLLTLSALERMGLLKKKETFLDTGSTPWSSVRDKLALISADHTDITNPRDMSYVTAGYAPLSARIVEYAVSPGWAEYQEGLREVRGASLEFEQGADAMELEQYLRRSGEADARPRPRARPASGKKPCLLVVYVGGVTFLEIAALRYLSKSPSFPFSILILTTKVFSGNAMLQGVERELATVNAGAS